MRKQVIVGTLIVILNIVVCQVALSDWYLGAATHFQGPQDLGYDSYDPKVPAGSCGYGELDPKLYPFWGVAQLSSNSPMVAGEELAGCGACFQVECLDSERCEGAKTTNVMITDSCEWCQQQQLNMHVFSFQYLAPSKWGEIPIRFRRIECQPPKDILIRVTDYRQDQGGWIRLVFLDVAGKADIATVELKQINNQNWIQMKNYYGAAWQLSGVPPPPFDLRVTLMNGENVVIENTIREVRIGGLYETKKQFKLKNNQKENFNSIGVNNSNQFPVFSMPPLDGSFGNLTASPFPLEAIARVPESLTAVAQGSKPSVTLDALLNPGITVTQNSNRQQSSTDSSTTEDSTGSTLSQQIQNSYNNKQKDKEKNKDDVIVLSLYPQNNDTDWNYLRQAFQRIGFLEPATEDNS